MKEDEENIKNFNIICPYCGLKKSENEELEDFGIHVTKTKDEYTCPKCNKKFKVTIGEVKNLIRVPKNGMHFLKIIFAHFVEYNIKDEKEPPILCSYDYIDILRKKDRIAVVYYKEEEGEGRYMEDPIYIWNYTSGGFRAPYVVYKS